MKKDSWTKYKYLIDYKVNGKKETAGAKTDAEKNKILKMMRYANKPDSGYKNKYTEIKVSKVTVELKRISNLVK